MGKCLDLVMLWYHYGKNGSKLYLSVTLEVKIVLTLLCNKRKVIHLGQTSMKSCSDEKMSHAWESQSSQNKTGGFIVIVHLLIAVQQNTNIKSKDKIYKDK